MISELCRSIDARRSFDKPFTIGTLVTNPIQYRTMVDSFVRGGFTVERADYLYIDNTASNRFDAFAGLNRIIEEARGEFIILCHQDVTLLSDGCETLLKRLRDLQQIDPNWAVAGNAGGTGHRRYAIHITNRDGSLTKTGRFPCQVESLDENFIVLKRSAMLAFSNDLTGFHLYGTDIVLQAELRGYKGYGIDFHLHHHGAGAMDASFFEGELAFERKYARLFRTRHRQGLSRRVLLTSSRILMALQTMRLQRRIKALRQKP